MHFFISKKKKINNKNIQFILNKPDNEIKNTNNNYLYDNNELDRLHDQNWLIEHIFGFKFCVPLEKQLIYGINILDSGCGPGTWVLDMATEYPDSIFYGLDINSIYPEQIKPKNCNFYKCDITSNIEINKLKIIDINFYYIRQRLLCNSLKFDEWDSVINRLKNITINGGWLEFIELDLKAYNPGPKLKILNNIVINTMNELGYRPNIASDLKNILENIKLESINEITKKVYFKDKTNKISILFYENIKKLHFSYKFWLEKNLNLENISYENYIEEAIKECQENDTYYVLYCVYGKKV